MKILIIGLGKIGGYTAYSILKNEKVRKLVMIGSDLLKTTGICQDLRDAYPHKNIEPSDLSGIGETFDLTILSFSTLKWHPGIDVNDRLIEAAANISVLKEIEQKAGFEKLGTIVVVSNPVDILTMYISREFKARNVIGFGLSIDEKRITEAVNKLVKRSYVRVPCIGEHGFTITPLLSKLSLDEELNEELYHKVKSLNFEATSTIIKNASIPVFGPLSELEILLNTIINEQNGVIPGSYFLHQSLFGESHVAAGLPVKFEKGKITGHDLKDISELETQLFKKSVEQIRQNYDALLARF